MDALVAVAMEPDKYHVHAGPGPRGDSGDSGPCNSRSRTNLLPNGVTSLSRHAPLRTALSREENEDEHPDADSTDDGERNNMETRPCPKYRSCRERACPEFDADGPSGSGVSSRRAPAVDEAEGRRRSRKRAADCRAERSNLEADDLSSDTSNDDYSLGSEDGCIYTYRGGEHLADLPSSFFSLDMGLPRDRQLPVRPPYAPPVGQDAAEERSSPDMDFLEMDFDPGPSCEADSGEESSLEQELDASPSPEVLVPRGTTPDAGAALREPSLPMVAHAVPIAAAAAPAEVLPALELGAASAGADPCQPSTSSAGEANITRPVSPGSAAGRVHAGALISHVNARGERLLVRRTFRRWPLHPVVTHHTTSGDLICERGEGACAGGTEATTAANLSSALYHCTMAKRLMVEKPTTNFLGEADTSNLTDSEAGARSGEGEESVCEVPRCMIWSEREASERQVTQIGTSACGATAVINVFLALGIPIDMEKVNKAVGTRQRANNAPIPRYLMSRAVAGCTAEDLVAGLQQASAGLVTARFFPTHPERVLSLSHWLADWISLGAVPVATLNLQAGWEGQLSNSEETPDAWHHQMVFGVSPRGVFLTNPVQCVAESLLWPQLCSDSVLLVRSRDVLSRLTPTTDLAPLMAVPDPRWATFNVLGQVVNVVRELRACEAAGGGCGRVRSRHVRVPCAYRAGVTVAALTGSEAHRRLTRAQPLPLYASPL